jgi:hypothetical protein
MGFIYEFPNEREMELWSSETVEGSIHTLDYENGLPAKLPLDNFGDVDVEAGGSGSPGPVNYFAADPIRSPGVPDSMGLLGRLPIEVLGRMIMEDLLDMSSLAALRSVSKALRIYVGRCLPIYHRLITECPDVVRALVATKRPFPTMHMYATLCTWRCGACYYRFGEYLHLLTGTRVCNHCVAVRPQYEPVTDAGRQLYQAMVGLPDIDLTQTADYMVALPGTYGPPAEHRVAHLQQGRRRVVYVPPPFRPGELLWDVRTIEEALVSMRGHAAKVRGLISPDLLFEGTPEEKLQRRFAAVVSAPVIDSASCFAPEPGMYCLGCEHKTNLADSRHGLTRYTWVGFSMHVAGHGSLEGDGQGGWKHKRSDAEVEGTGAELKEVTDPDNAHVVSVLIEISRGDKAATAAAADKETHEAVEAEANTDEQLVVDEQTNGQPDQSDQSGDSGPPYHLLTEHLLAREETEAQYSNGQDGDWEDWDDDTASDVTISDMARNPTYPRREETAGQDLQQYRSNSVHHRRWIIHQARHQARHRARHQPRHQTQHHLHASTPRTGHSA